METLKLKKEKMLLFIYEKRNIMFYLNEMWQDVSLNSK